MGKAVKKRKQAYDWMVAGPKPQSRKENLIGSSEWTTPLTTAVTVRLSEAVKLSNAPVSISSQPVA